MLTFTVLRVMDRDWFIAQKAHSDPHEFICREGNSLAVFCAMVLDSIQSMTIGPASMKRYLGITS